MGPRCPGTFEMALVQGPFWLILPSKQKHYIDLTLYYIVEHKFILMFNIPRRTICSLKNVCMNWFYFLEAFEKFELSSNDFPLLLSCFEESLCRVLKHVCELSARSPSLFLSLVTGA